MPEDLCQIATPASEDIEIAGVGIPLQVLLNLQSQALHAAAHVGVAGRDPDPDAARYRDHRRLRTSRTRPNVFMRRRPPDCRMRANTASSIMALREGQAAC